MKRVILTLKLDPKDASVDKAREILGLNADQIDPDFGVVGVSPKEDLYAVLVDEDVAASAAGSSDDASGPFANPKIETFRPPS